MMLEFASPLTGARRHDLGFPFKFSRSPLTVRRGPTLVSSDTVDMLRELGYSDNEIEALREAQTIG